MKLLTFICALLCFFNVSNGFGVQKSPARMVNPESVSTTLTKITNGIGGAESNFGSAKMSFSDNGRYIAYQSEASNLVSGDTNYLSDIFLYDTQTNTTTLLSNGLSGAKSNGQSFDPVISGDGNYVTFVSYASNLVSGDTNNRPDVFRVNVSTGLIIRVSVTNAGLEGNGSSGEPSISQDGNLISFTSNSNNLVSSDLNAASDIFVRNISAGTTTRVSVSTSGIEGDKNSYRSKISSDGSVIAFTSDATNLVSSDTNLCSDIFLRNLSLNTTQIVSSSASGSIGNRSSLYPDVSSNGQYVVFQSRATNLISSDTNEFIDIFMKNMSTGAVTLISQKSDGSQVNNDSVLPSISLDGRFVVFESKSSDYVTWDNNSSSDVFIRDNQSGLTTPFSTLASNVVGNSKSIGAKISGDGTKLGFASLSTNLVTPKTSNQMDLFARANPVAAQVVNITPISNLTPNGVSQNAFLVTRYGSTSSSLTVHYSVSGTAVSGTDFTALTGTITIAASSATATISIVPTSSSIVSANKSILVSLSEDTAYTIGGKDSASVQIQNNNDFEVNVIATHATLTKDGTEVGVLQVSRSGGTLGDLTVYFNISGTAIPGVDYVKLPAYVVIPNGQANVNISLVGILGELAEFDKSIILTLSTGSGYHIGSNSSASATVRANGLYEVNIQSIDGELDGSNVADTGSFRIYRSSNGPQNLTVYYSLKGTAINGVDYQTLSGTATISAGSQYVDVVVTPILNTTSEQFKTISVELIPGSMYLVGSSSITSLVIKESPGKPTVSITAINPTATEDGTTTGTIRVSRTGSTSSSLGVSYFIGGSALNGVDYSMLLGTITIPSGQSYADITITGIADIIAEPTESVILALQSSSDYVIDQNASDAQVNILDNNQPSVRIYRESTFATPNQSSVPKIWVRRNGSLSSNLTVNLSYSGSAIPGTDFVNPGATVVIPSGSDSVSFDIKALPGTLAQGNREITINVGSSSAYTLDTLNSTKVVIVGKSYKLFQDYLSITPNADISSMSISDDGRYIAFATSASNLVVGDTNSYSDIYVVDTVTKNIRQVLAANGAQPNGPSRNPSLSADGRYVVFSTLATNFSIHDQNSYEDIYMVDLTTNVISYVSQGYTSNGSKGGDSLNPIISADGKYVVFESSANNLVGNDTNNVADIFRYNRVTGILDRVNLHSSGDQFSGESHKPSISVDGKLIAFETKEYSEGVFSNSFEIVLKNLANGTVSRVSTPLSGSDNNGDSSRPIVSDDGNFVLYQSFSTNIVNGDVNDALDVFRYSVESNSNQIVSASKDGWVGNKTSSLSAVNSTGDLALFISNAKNLGDSSNCTNLAYVKSLSQNSVYSIDNKEPDDCSEKVQQATMSRSGKFILSTLNSLGSFREITISSNPLN